MEVLRRLAHSWIVHPLDLDIGEVADGYHLMARSISLLN